MDDRIQGVIKWFNADKGFGFIEVEGRDDVFLHHTGMDDSRTMPSEGLAVEFTLGEGKKGPQAINVIAIDSEAGQNGSDQEMFNNEEEEEAPMAA